MILPVDGVDGNREFCIVELQGELQHCDGLKAGFTVGDLSLHPSKNDILHLQIGYHRLEGKRVQLPKPIAIFRRTLKKETLQVHVGQNDDEGSLCHNTDNAIVGFSVIGFIRCKYIFKNRPKALISTPHL